VAVQWVKAFLCTSLFGCTLSPPCLHTDSLTFANEERCTTSARQVCAEPQEKEGNYLQLSLLTCVEKPPYVYRNAI